MLRLERVGTDAEVRVGDQMVGTVRWPAGEVDLTDAIPAGTTKDPTILVAALKDRDDSVWYQDAQTIFRGAAEVRARGLLGDVVLACRPTGGHVRDVFVQTSTRQNSITLDIELAQVTESGEAQFIAEMRNEQGEIEKRLTDTRTVDAADLQRMQLSWDWSDPKPWDTDSPHQYTLLLTVRGEGINDVYPQRFGFREFWINGRQLLLNGKPIRLRRPSPRHLATSRRESITSSPSCRRRASTSWNSGLAI